MPATAPCGTGPACFFIGVRTEPMEKTVETRHIPQMPKPEWLAEADRKRVTKLAVGIDEDGLGVLLWLTTAVRTHPYFLNAHEILPLVAAIAERAAKSGWTGGYIENPPNMATVPDGSVMRVHAAPMYTFSDSIILGLQSVPQPMEWFRIDGPTACAFAEILGNARSEGLLRDLRFVQPPSGAKN